MNQSKVHAADLQSRVDQLKRAEQDLSARVAKRVSAMQNEGRWHLSDPLYQRLWFALAGVRADLRGAQESLA